MAKTRAHEPQPMPHTKAHHLLNPLRSLILTPEKLVARLDLSPDFRVLELGPGPGYFSPTVARSVPEGKLVLVDVQQEMIGSAEDAGFRYCATHGNFLSYTVNFRKER